MSTQELSDEDKFLLIDCVKARPVIWDVSNKYYKTRDKSTEWQKVVKEMVDSTGRQFGVEHTKHQWEALRRQFNNNKVKKRTGDAALQKPKWRFWDTMIFIECGADVKMERVSSVSVKKEEESFSGDIDSDEDVKVIAPSNSKAILQNQNKTPTIHRKATPSLSEKPAQAKRRKVDPELELIDKLICQQEQIDPLATMVDNMCAKLGKPRFCRACFDFKQAIMTTLNEYESWLIDQEFIEERGVFDGQYNEDKTDIGAEETLPPH